MWLALTLMIGCREDLPGAVQFDGKPPTNVLMISVDTLRRDAVGHYNAESQATPYLDGLLSEGLTLEDHRSCSNWTYGAVVCAMTGKTGAEVGFIPGSWDSQNPIPDDISLLPGWLRREGFGTGLVTSNFYIGSTSGLVRDFDVVFQEHEGDAALIVDKALVTHKELEDEDRWFLHAHFFDPHAGYDPPEAYLDGLEALEPSAVDVTDGALMQRLEESWGDLTAAEQAATMAHMQLRYAGEVQYIDDQIKRLMQTLEDRGALEDTLVVLWSDHGEQFGEHGAFDHGKSLYSGELDGIAAFWAEDIVGDRWTGPTDHADLAPTLMAALGLEVPEEVTGTALGINSAAGPRFALRRNEFHLQSVDYGGCRLMYWWEDGRLALYDVEADPGEQDDLYDPADPRVQALWALLKPRVEAVLPLVPGDAAPVWPKDMP